MSTNERYKYGRYASSLIASVSNNTIPQKPPVEMDWDRFYDFAIEQNISALIFPAIKKLNVPQNVFSKFDKDQYQKMAREAKICIEAQRIFNALSHENLDYIIMKGIIVKDVYPLSYMRTFGDVDLYVGSKGREKVKPIMESLGYSIQHTSDSHDEYENGIFNFEMHSSIHPAGYPNILSHPFDHCEHYGSDPHSFVLDANYFYIHLLTHLYKHFAYSGCGIRLYCDLYFYEKAYPNLDMQMIESEMKKYGFYEFYTHTKTLLRIFFENGESDNRYDHIMEYIFSSSVQGDHDLMRMYRNYKLGFIDKIKHIMYYWFGYEILSKKYPTLKKAPILLPWFWIIRLVGPLLRDHDVVKARANDIKTINSQKFKDAKKARKLVGMK